VLAESAVELPEVSFNPVQPRLKPVHAASKLVHAAPDLALQSIKRPLVDKHSYQNRQSRQADHDIELHVIHSSSVPRYCSVVQSRIFALSVRR